MGKKKLEVKDVTVEINGTTIIDNVSINLYEGEIVSILGTSGGGKTTLFNVIAGLIIPKNGKVNLNDENIVGKTGKISYMLQKDLLLPFKTIIDNVSLPLIIRGEKKQEARKKASQYFKQFGLEGTENNYPKSLSGGMRQRAALLRTYMFSNEIALLDEPFSALDAITKQKMHNWYIELMKNIKMSTLFITHDIDEAILLSNRIYILGDKPGRILTEIKIELDKTKTVDELVMMLKFLEYKNEIKRYLK